MGLYNTSVTDKSTDMTPCDISICKCNLTYNFQVTIDIYFWITVYHSPLSGMTVVSPRQKRSGLMCGQAST
jgi:hypothetical protein